MGDENEEFEFRARAEREGSQVGAPDALVDHTGIVGRSLAASVKTPFQLPPIAGHQANTPGSPFGAMPQMGEVPWSAPEQAMAKSGVDITSGAPYGLRNRLSLMVDPKDADVRNVVNQSYGQDVGLARNQYGELEYTNPQTGRRTLLNSRGQNLPNLAPTAGGAMDAVGQAGGALAAGLPTAAATGNPLLAGMAASAGAGVGQAVSDTGKTIINHFLGAGNKEDPDAQIGAIAKDAGSAAAWTAAGELVGMTPGAVRWAGRGFLDLTYGKARDLQAMAKEAANGLSDYNTLIGSQAGVKPNIAELVPQSPLARIYNEKAYKSSEELTAEEEKRINSNLDTLSYNYQNFTDAFKPSPTYQSGSSGYNIQQAMEAKKAVALSQQQLQDSLVKADAKQQIAGLPAMTETERNQELTGMLNKLETAGKEAKDKAYGDLKVSLGVPEQVAYDRTSGQWMQGRTAENVVEMSPVAQAKLQNMWAKGMQLQNSPLRSGDKYFSAIPENFFVDVNAPEEGLNFNFPKSDTGFAPGQVWGKDSQRYTIGEVGADGQTAKADFADGNPPSAVHYGTEKDNGWSLVGGDQDTPKKFDILDLIDNVQDLNSGTRAAMAASKGRIPADEQATAHVSEILANEVRYHLNVKGDPRILDQWEAAQQANQQYEENFGRGILNTVMKRTGGFEDPVYNSATSRLLMSAGQGQDQTGVATLANVLRGSPDEQERVRSMIWSIYKDHYLPASGIPDKASWQKYSAQMEGPMKHFFTDAENAKMQSFSDMTDAVAASSKSLATFNQAWRRSPEYGGIPTNSTSLSGAVFNKTPPQVIDKMTSMLGSMQPSLLKEWQADTAREFARRTADASGMPVDAMVSKYVNQYGDKLSKVMGPQYVSDLRTYQKVAQMVQGGTGIKLDPDRPQSVLTQVIRAKFAPPMSAEGRWYSALLNWRKEAAGRVVYNALKSPENLNSFIKSTASSAATPTAMGIMGQLKGQALASSLLGAGKQQPNNTSSDKAQ